MYSKDNILWEDGLAGCGLFLWSELPTFLELILQVITWSRLPSVAVTGRARVGFLSSPGTGKQLTARGAQVRSDELR